MTLVEFLAPLAKSKSRDKCLAVLYYAHRYAGQDVLTVEEVRAELKRARVSGWSKMNVADVLSKAGHLVDAPAVKGSRRAWKLTDAGKDHVRSLLGLPTAEVELEHDVGTLVVVAATLVDEHVRAYVEEALKCLQVGALRACVVFLWTGAIRLLQEGALAKGSAAVQAAVTTHDPKARKVQRIDDFAYIKDSVTLKALYDLGVIDKGQRSTLEEALNLRNRCGHPTKYRPGIKKVSSFIEDLLGIAFE